MRTAPNDQYGSIFVEADALVRQFSSAEFLDAVGRTTFLFHSLPALDRDVVGELVWDLLAATKFSASNVRLAQDGEIIRAPRKTVRGRAYADPRELLEGLQRGETFNMIAVERLRSDLRIFSTALQDIFGVPVQANLYASYAGSTAGYNAHKDSHDVVVLQLTGTKQWTVHVAPPSGISVERRPPNLTELTQPTEQFVLESGSCLYVPAGFVHDAATLDGVSIHLTYGIGCLRWYDVLLDVLADADDAELFQRVPLREDEINSEYESRIAAMVRDVLSGAAIVDAVDRWKEFGGLSKYERTIRRALAAPRTKDDR
jgi:hypothetical protein